MIHSFVPSQLIFIHTRTGEFLKYVPHHQGATKEKMSDLEELGRVWRYKCPFEGCDRNTRKVKINSMGYKEFAIHCGE